MVILFNDTSTVEANPGCELTVKGLKSMIGQSPCSRPLGFCYDVYRRSPRRFPLTVYKIYKRLANDPEFRASQIVLFNGEGTIHHEEKGTHVLLIILAIARLFGKRVLLANCSVEGVSRRNAWLLRFAHLILVREAISQGYLATQGIKATVTLDCAFLTPFQLAPTNFLPKPAGQRNCLFNPGVLLEHNSNNEDELRKHFLRIQGMGYTPCYLQVQEKEQKDAQFWETLGGPVIRRSNYRSEDVFNILNEADLIISGRYHLLIFAIMVRKPFIALDTNTWKIRGLLGTLDTRFGTNFAQHCETGNRDDFATDYEKLNLSEIRKDIVSSYRATLGEAFNTEYACGSAAQ